tara:strand:+ start:2492 stop:4228 length:1737 start_codon:yes stop_codon:yes gene_type:complete
MLFKNTASQGVYCFMIDSGTGEGKTGDASNISVTISLDGGATSASSNSVSEIGGGVYALTLTQGETNADRLAIIPSSSTASVVGSPIIAYTTGGAVPAAAAGASTGLALTSSVDAVDTVADGIATTLGTAGAGLTDLGGMSTAMKAEVNAEVDTALGDYDAPTKAEMDAKFSTTDGLITTVDGVADGIATTLGTAGAGLTDLGGMSTGMKAEVNAEADAALADYDAPTKSEMDDAFTAVKGATFDTSTDSLEAIRNRGDSSWLTATGFNTTTPPTASAVADAVWDEVQSAHTTSGTFGYYLDAQVSSAASPPTAAAIADAVWDELTSAHTVSGSYGKAIGDGISDWVTATGFSTFNPSSDTVANVTTVGSVSGTVSADVVSVSGDSTAAANLEADYDGTGYAKTNSTIGTTTTNTDMRGTDSAFLASSAPTNFGDLAITASTGRVTVGTNSDKTGYSISGTLQTLDELNNFDPAADTVANVTTAGTVTNGVTVSTVSDGAIGADAVADIWSTTALAESYASDGSTGTGAQLLYQIQQALTEFAISSTTLTVKKLDGSTTASTYTLDDASAPTSRTRAS